MEEMLKATPPGVVAIVQSKTVSRILGCWDVTSQLRENVKIVDDNVEASRWVTRLSESNGAGLGMLTTRERLQKLTLKSPAHAARGFFAVHCSHSRTEFRRPSPWISAGRLPVGEHY